MSTRPKDWLARSSAVVLALLTNVAFAQVGGPPGLPPLPGAPRAPGAPTPGQPGAAGGPRTARGAVVRGVDIPAAKVQKLARPPIATRPFTLNDLAQRRGLPPGRAPAADEEVVLTGLTKKGPVRIKAAALLQQTNDLERKLNASGHSLREKGAVKLGESKIDRNNLGRQRAAAAQKVRPPKTAIPRASLQAAVQQRTASLQAAPRTQAAIVAQRAVNATPRNMPPLHEAWDVALGDRDVLAAALGATLDVSGTPAGLGAGVNGTARITLFQKDFDLLQVVGAASAPTTGAQQAKLTVRVLGMDLLSPINETGAQITKEGTQQIAIDQSVEVNFTVGPIPMVARFGAQGSAGIRYGFATSPSYMHVEAVPLLGAKAYGECAVDVVVAEAGIGGSLTIVDQQLELAATASIDVSGTQPTYNWQYYGLENLNMLSGEIYAFARVDYAIDTWEGRYTIFSWDGMSLRGYLFGQTGSMPMFTGGPSVHNVDPASMTANPNYCPEGKFSTMGKHHGCTCQKGDKHYGGIASSEAWCAGALVCPGGKFSTTGKWRGCACPPGTSKKYSGLFDKDAKCK